MDLSAYTLAPLHQDGEFVLCRGRAIASPPSHPPSVLVSVLASQHPVPARLRMLEHELAFRDDLDSTWALRPIALAQYEGRQALIREDRQGEPLARLLDPSATRNQSDDRPSDEPAMELGLFLRLAVGLARALSGVHRRGIIHKNIKPAHVLVNAATGQAWLTGFGIASRLPRQRQTPEPPETLAGTLAYMAPEQTGHMNRSSDGRSDLYALGVTLYQMLTGSLPFTATEPIEWVHCHIARQPMAPRERVGEVPVPVSAIIMKLLAKTGEERYQTAAGLERDLQRCLSEWEAERRIDDFPLGEDDIPDRLLIPEKLYGRARQVETLLAAFDRVVESGVPELVLVSGYSGIGKSSVVNELQPMLVPPRALFAAGKFDQYKRDIPYSTLAQAFSSLVRRLLARSDVELDDCREALREALGPNGQLMLDLIPELRLIIGEQAPVHELPPQDAQRRFQLVFRRFLAVFARPEHPLALFLDDLQWLDAATLDLLEDLLTHADVRHVLLIGAYRNNEVTSIHPLIRTLDRMRGAGVPVHDVVLVPLAGEHVSELLADALHCDNQRAAPLAELVLHKTAGNPFFVIQFVSALADEGLLTFDYVAARWSWDLVRIHAQGYTDNVVDLMVDKLTRLPLETQTVLQRLACLGNSAEFSRLAMVHEDSEEDLRSHLQEAVRTQLVLYTEGFYRFLHDRVHEAAYSLIPKDQRAEAHLTIGRLLVTNIPPEKRDEAIFEIVNQLNLGAQLITSDEEGAQLAELNLAAGKRAKASSAYASALRYLTAGAAMLPEDRWERRQELAFELELQPADCEVCTGALQAAEERLAALTRRAAGTVQRCAVARRRVELYTLLGAGERAVIVALECLRHVGIAWSAHPSDVETRGEYERIWSLVGAHAIEDLVNLPLMQDPDVLATLDILAKLSLPAEYVDENLVALSIFRATILSLEYGNNDVAPVSYAGMGMIASARFGHHERGYRIARMACDLVERCGLSHFAGRVYNRFAVVVPWTRPLAEAIDPARRGFHLAARHGEPAFASYACRNLVSVLLAMGRPLDQVEREAEQGLAFVLPFGSYLDRVSAPLALVRTLRGKTATFGSLDDGRFTEQAFEEEATGEPVRMFLECYYWLRKLQARFFAGDYVSALAAAEIVRTWYANAASLSLLVVEKSEYQFYAALCHAASCQPTGSDPYDRHEEALQTHERELRSLAASCPDNFEARATLVGAEIARLEGRELDAERLYEAAVTSARENELVHDEALANELAARFYTRRGFERIAKAYLRDARDGYRQWGADGKVRQLEAQYPYLTHEQPASDPTHTMMTPVEHLDLSTVLKVSQAVQGETNLEKLIAAIMRLGVEHAGAERGLLILPHGDSYRIEAQATSSHDGVTVDLRQESVEAGELPHSVFQYVLRTRERVLLGATSAATELADDEYLRRHHARSVLCIPLLKQTRLAGILYLENTLTSDAFTPARMALLEVLASEAAISLENARLYRDLQEREARVRRLIDANIIGISIWHVDGRILDANEEFLRIIGYDREDLVSGRVRWTDLTPPEERDLVLRTLEEVTAGGDQKPVERELLKKDGSRVPVLAGGTTFEGVPDEGLGFMIDLTERKRDEAEIRALKEQLYRENLALRDEVDRASMFEEIVGTSPTLKAVLSRIAKVAPTDSTVFISGETGTGKELIARAVHKRSRKAGRAFVSVNCAALAPTLISSELFGHEKGAFTGATQRRLGRFELADGGTIFLDEVGELLSDTQAMLLRVLQEREFERVGGTQPVRVDVRVIAATNRDLQAAIANGSFRQDLYYRLNVFPIDVPPLRARKDDLVILLEYFVQRYASRAGKQIRSIDKRTLDLLQAYDWPGNIRELQNVVERSVILSTGGVFAVDELWLSTQSPLPAPRTRPSVPFAGDPPRSEREIIESALAESRGRIAGPSGAAARLHIPASTLESRIKSLKINKSQFKFGGSSRDNRDIR
jgi:PAS domain S-box-containing protein